MIFLTANMENIVLKMTYIRFALIYIKTGPKSVEISQKMLFLN